MKGARLSSSSSTARAWVTCGVAPGSASESVGPLAQADSINRQDIAVSVRAYMVAPFFLDTPEPTSPSISAPGPVIGVDEGRLVDRDAPKVHRRKSLRL